MAITLATIRARIRTQMESAWGYPEPLPVTASTETQATLRDRVESLLQDSTNAKWSTADIDETVEKALEEYNRHTPALAVTTITLSSAGREIDVSSISNLLRVQKVWHPYDSTSPSWPPNWVQFDVYPGKILFIDETTEPANGDKVRIWYTTPAQLKDLNSAGATTIPADDITYLINGAAYYAAHQRAIEISETVTVDDDTFKHLLTWSNEQGKAFRYGIRKTQPSWQRHAYAYQNPDIDEAIRWALGKFNEIAPQETLGTITLSSDGREIALTTLTDLLRVTRVWWPYDSSDPVYTPNWVRYEVWGNGPTGTLFIDDDTEPSSGDVVRVWYLRLCAVKDLDSAAATTLPDDAETILVTGATGYLSKERIMEEPTSRWRVPRALREWAEQQLLDFDLSLARYARRQAAGAAGLGHLPPMDKWESQDDDKW